jgi:hypothetical protein
MKHILLLSGTLCLLSAAGFSQESAKKEKENIFEIQAKGIGSSTWLFNKNISDQGDLQNYANGIGITYGLAFNAYFGSIGVGVEGLMGNHQGGYSGTFEMKDGNGQVVKKWDYTSNVNLKTIQIPLLFKLRSANGAYLELGPQYNMISGADYHYSGDGVSKDTSVYSNYSSSYISAVLGLGVKVKFGESPLSMNIGLRLQYGLTDLKGVDALGRRLDDAFYYKSHQNTNAAAGGLMIAFTYQLNKKKS